MNTLSVVIPAYNEESGIAQIIERVLPIRAGLRGVLAVMRHIGMIRYTPRRQRPLAEW